MVSFSGLMMTGERRMGHVKMLTGVPGDCGRKSRNGSGSGDWPQLPGPVSAPREATSACG